jgi:hypothetical protein
MGKEESRHFSPLTLKVWTNTAYLLIREGTYFPQSDEAAFIHRPESFTFHDLT